MIKKQKIIAFFVLEVFSLQSMAFTGYNPEQIYADETKKEITMATNTL